MLPIAPLAPERIAFLGLGLIGGSIARALRAGGGGWSKAELVAWTPSNRGPSEALLAGVIDRAADSVPKAIRGADLVILAAPPSETIMLLEDLAESWRSSLSSEAVITDVTSTKVAIVTRAASLGLRFVGGHPMAGREAIGFGASVADLFVDRPWAVVSPGGAAPRDVENIEDLARTCRARPLRMAAAEHDAATAAVSHVPLIVAAALVEALPAIEWEPLAAARAAELAASGWLSATRLARGDPTMGAGIAATNAHPIALQLRAFRDALDAWLLELERGDGRGTNGSGSSAGPDPDRLRARFAAARDRLARMDEGALNAGSADARLDRDNSGGA
jgi:prephenate dehydrogenase